MVKWLRLEGKSLEKNVRSHVIEMVDLIEDLHISEDFKSSREVDDINFIFDTRKMIGPLGDYGRMLLETNEVKDLQCALRKYYAHKEGSVMTFDAIKDESTSGEWLTLRSRIYLDPEKAPVSLERVVKEARLSEASSLFKSVVIGSDNWHLELQLLVESLRKEVKVGDFIDPGLFISLGDKVKFAVGINRLKCTNGLIQPLRLWDSDNFDFLRDQKLLESGLGMITWLQGKVGKRVNAVREIAMALGSKYSESLLKKFWKSWAERIDLKELDWFDVVADLTLEANKTLGSGRYRLLEVGDSIIQYDKDSRCPICFAPKHSGTAEPEEIVITD